MCVRVCVKSGSRSVVSHCMFLLFPQMRNPAFGSCTARSSGEPRFLVVGRSRKTGQHSRTVHPGKWNRSRNTFSKACLLLKYKNNIFLYAFPKKKKLGIKKISMRKNKWPEFHLKNEPIALDEVTDKNGPIFPGSPPLSPELLRWSFPSRLP